MPDKETAQNRKEITQETRDKMDNVFERQQPKSALVILEQKIYFGVFIDLSTGKK